MEELEQRVWQRVMNPAENVLSEAKTLIPESQALASGFGMLAKNSREDRKALLKELYREEQGILHTLRGICRLQGQPVSLRFPMTLREPEGRILEKSYYKCLHLRREYLARSAAGEFAQVYGILADRAGEQSARILRLLGML